MGLVVGDRGPKIEAALRWAVDTSLTGKASPSGAMPMGGARRTTLEATAVAAATAAEVSANRSRVGSLHGRDFREAGSTARQPARRSALLAEAGDGEGGERET